MPHSHYFPRLKFPKGEQSEFINNIIRINQLSSEGFAKIMGIPSRTVSDWRREKYNISEYFLIKTCLKFDIPIPNKIDEYRENWEIHRHDLDRKGGFARFKLHGSPATLEGCKKGGSKALSILRKNGVIPLCKNFYAPKHKNNKLAEFFGIMLGDGSLSNLQGSITLNSIADRDYIKFVSKLIRKLFLENASVSKKKDCNAKDIRFSGINLVQFLVKNGLKIGNKVKNQVSVPRWIQDCPDFKIYCLRGLMDTDGCICRCTHFVKSKKYVYFNPCFTNRSIPLLHFVYNTLLELGLHPSITGYHVWLYNKQEVIKYFNIIGSDNYRLLKFKESMPIG